MNQAQQPEALRLAQMLEALGWRSVDKDLREAAAELRRLHQVELAFREFLAKTEWVQKTAEPGELGMHRADVLRTRIEASQAQCAPLKPDCSTCNDHGAVGNILTAEPCPDCTAPAIREQALAKDAARLDWIEGNGDVHIQKVRAGFNGPIRWDVEYGPDGKEARSKVDMRAAIDAAMKGKS